MSLGLDEQSRLPTPHGAGEPSTPTVDAGSAEPAPESPFAELGLTYDDVLLHRGRPTSSPATSTPPRG